MTRNAESYTDPERFWPERFEKADSEAADLLDPRKLVFGFGRRYAFRLIHHSVV